MKSTVKRDIQPVHVDLGSLITTLLCRTFVAHMVKRKYAP